MRAGWKEDSRSWAQRPVRRKVWRVGRCHSRPCPGSDDGLLGLAFVHQMEGHSATKSRSSRDCEIVSILRMVLQRAENTMCDLLLVIFKLTMQLAIVASPWVRHGMFLSLVSLDGCKGGTVRNYLCCTSFSLLDAIWLRKRGCDIAVSYTHLTLPTKRIV